MNSLFSITGTALNRICCLHMSRSTLIWKRFGRFRSIFNMHATTLQQSISIFFYPATSLAAQSHLYSLLEEYHSVLSETMKNLNCRATAPSLKDIRKMYDDRIFISVVVTCPIEPILHAQSSKVYPIDDLVSDDSQGTRKLYGGDNFRKKLMARLPEYAKLGLLDA
ncbi:uncharacterized protein LOC107047840 [Diachasma alloeum]|uniref:uncharacterized protein LOC107047840 n=1 Tax=Diachasma alloeum TaxID=454923 RepID=UPI0007385034|nr:uncharacterized protein LOC107047840 [Diachasma alloeum]